MIYHSIRNVRERLKTSKVVLQYNPDDRERAIFAKAGEMHSGGEMHAVEAMRPDALHNNGVMPRSSIEREHMLNGELNRSDAWRREGTFHLGNDEHGKAVRDVESDTRPGDTRALLAHELRLSARNPEDLKARQERWNTIRWQDHLLGVPIDSKDKSRLSDGIARGTEKAGTAKDLASNKNKIKKGGLVSIYGDKNEKWTEDRLATENPNSLYRAWADHSGKIEDSRVESAVHEANLHGLPVNEPSILEGRNHIISSSPRLGLLPAGAPQEDALKQLTDRNLTVKDIEGNYRSLLKTVENPDGTHEAQHWYEGAHVFGREIGNRFGVDHNTVTGIVASHSPNTGWGKNRELTARTILLQRENPTVYVDQAHIDAFRATRLSRNAKADKALTSKAKDREDRIAARIDENIPDDMKPGYYHVNDLPAHLVGRTLSLGTFSDNTTRALNVLRTRDTQRFVRGPKISSFHSNISDPHEKDISTIDIHAAMGAVGNKVLDWRDANGKIVERRPARKGDESALLSGEITGTEGQGIMPAAQQALTNIAQELHRPTSSVQASAWHAIKITEGGS